jgi:hypothetical protein
MDALRRVGSSLKEQQIAFPRGYPFKQADDIVPSPHVDKLSDVSE